MFVVSPLTTPTAEPELEEAALVEETPSPLFGRGTDWSRQSASEKRSQPKAEQLLFELHLDRSDETPDDTSRLSHALITDQVFGSNDTVPDSLEV